MIEKDEESVNEVGTYDVTWRKKSLESREWDRLDYSKDPFQSSHSEIVSYPYLPDSL